MKTKIKRHYRSVVSVLLSVCMLISCMTVGLIATDAARVTGDDAVGARVEEDDAVGITGIEFKWWRVGGDDHKYELTTQNVTEQSFTITTDGDFYFGATDAGGNWLYNTGNGATNPSAGHDMGATYDYSEYFWLKKKINNESVNTRCWIRAGTYTVKWTNNDPNGAQILIKKELPKKTITIDASSLTSYSSSSVTVTGQTSTTTQTVSLGSTGTVSLTQGETANVTVGALDSNYKPTATIGNTNVPLSFNGTNYTGSFTVPNTDATLTIGSTAKTSYSVVVKNTDGLGTVYPTTAQTVMEDSPVTLTAVPTGNNYFKKWQGTVYSSSDNPATYYVNDADADGSTITITGNFGTNHYTASAGNSLAPANIYAGINATFFDYYYDNEVTNGWLHFNGENNDVNPYKTFNTALSEYAKGNGVKIPLYFGNIYWPEDNNDTVFSHENGNFLNYTNWFGPPNNVDRLRRDSHYTSAVGGITDSATHYAITGLTGTKLSSDHNTIYHFDKDATNNTGVPMALFDEDWLTHRETYTEGGVEKDYSYKGALATIIDSPFPVVKQEYYRLYFTKPSGWGGVNAYFYKNGSPTYGSWPGNAMSCLSGDLYYLDIPKADIDSVKDATVIFSNSSNPGSEGDTTNRKTTNVPSGTDTTDWYTGSAWSNKGDFTKTIDYYGFNSTGGQDNAYFTGLNNGSPNNLQMQYGAGESYAVKDNQPSGRGCFPFDGEDLRGQNEQAKDYGFGVRMDIPFTLGQYGKINGVNQIFEFSGDDDLWVFIDGELVLDLGGAHRATTGYIDFGHGTDQAKVVANTAVANVQYPGGEISAVERNHTSTSGVFSFTNTGDDVEITKHTMTLYYMERGMGESNLKFGFSFTPVSNEFMTEKKLGTDNVNSALKSDVETAVAGDKFNFTNEWSASTSNEDFSNLASDKKYTLIHNGAKSNETTADNSGILPHQNEWFSFGDQTEFVGQFTVGQYFKLEEAAKSGNSAYTYTPSLEVKDVVTGGTISADNGAYLFKTTKATTDATNYNADTDPTRIKATYTNSVLTKSVTITKAVTQMDVDNPDFTVKVRVQLPGGSMKAYQLVSTSGTLNAEGTYTFKAGGSNTISGIPVGATVEVTEVSLPQDYSMTGWTVTCTDASTLNTNTSAHTFVIPSDGADTVTVALTNTKATGKNVKIYKTLTSGTSAQTYTMFIKTVSTLDDASPADYDGTYTVKNVSDDTTVGTANLTYTSAGVSITTAQYILLENVSTSTKLEVTEKELSSAYVRAFHYGYTSVKVGSGSTLTTQDEGGITASTNPKKIDNGVRFSVTDDTVVNVYNKPWTYYIKYNYPAYLARYYSTTPSEQWYDKSGTFTDADFDEGGLLTIGMENDSNSVEHPCPVFKDKANSYASIKDGLSNFITQKAPYEDNFMSTITWAPKFVTSGDDTKNTDITYYPTEDNSNVYISTHANEHPNKTVYAYFRLPYQHESWSRADGKRLDPIATDGKVLKKEWVNYKVETQYGTWVTLNNATTKSEAQWVEAAPEIYDSSNGKTYVFDYWQMTSIGYNESFVDVDNNHQPARQHALKREIPYKRCYNLAFNMTMYQDSYVEAVYVEKGDPRANMTQQQKEAADTNQVSNGAVINFLENSRNQWNNNGGTLYRESYENITSRIAKGDRIFSDFLLSFHMENDITLAGDLSKTVKEQAIDEQGNSVVDDEGNPVMVDKSYPIYQNGNTINYQIGVVVERLRVLDEGTEGRNYDIKTQAYYKAEFDSDESLETQKNNVATYISSGTDPDSKYLKDEFSAKALDNKNEMEYSYSLPVNNLNNRQNYVYRAFAYLKDYTIDPNATYTFNGTNIAATALGDHTGAILKVSDPVYFTIYDMASIQDGQTYTGGGQS